MAEYINDNEAEFYQDTTDTDTNTENEASYPTDDDTISSISSVDALDVDEWTDDEFEEEVDATDIVEYYFKAPAADKKPPVGTPSPQPSGAAPAKPPAAGKGGGGKAGGAAAPAAKGASAPALPRFADGAVVHINNMYCYIANSMNAPGAPAAGFVQFGKEA